MGQIQNAVLGMIGTAGVASYALQRTPAFQKHKEYKKPGVKRREAKKEMIKNSRKRNKRNR